MMGFLHQGL